MRGVCVTRLRMEAGEFMPQHPWSPASLECIVDSLFTMTSKMHDPTRDACLQAANATRPISARLDSVVYPEDEYYAPSARRRFSREELAGADWKTWYRHRHLEHLCWWASLMSVRRDRVRRVVDAPRCDRPLPRQLRFYKFFRAGQSGRGGARRVTRTPRALSGMCSCAVRHLPAASLTLFCCRRRQVPQLG